MVDRMVYMVGDTDPDGYTKLGESGLVEMWETPNENYVVYLMVSADDILYAFRKYEADAIALFDNVCAIVPDIIE